MNGWVFAVLLLAVDVFGDSGTNPATRCGTDWEDANTHCRAMCTTSCSTAGQSCFASLDTSPCTGAPSTTRCGSSWDDANTKCGTKCTTTCPNAGDECYGGLSITPCGTSCTKSCPSGYCGSNGCGGTCGCSSGQTCDSSTSKCCTPKCTSGKCGSNGCGGTCSCASGQTCVSSTSTCCTPKCTAGKCTSNGCGGTCSCTAPMTCASNGTCVSPPVNNAAVKLTMYWGQSANAAVTEMSLASACQTMPYDNLVLSFLNVFFDSSQPYSAPGLNFGGHCWTTFTGYSSLLDCPAITADILTCQSLGKKVLLSLGGAIGSYGFTSTSQAQSFASTIYNLFLGGSSTAPPRPFGKVILDGIDLDIEGGSSVGFTAFVNQLRTLNKNVRPLMITGAPQCPFPDAYLGPSTGTALGSTSVSSFDAIWVQFYNNYCGYNDPTQFWAVVDQWMKWGQSANSALKIYVGLPAATTAAASQDFIPTSQLPSIISKLKSTYKNFGGIMLWDVSYDQQTKYSTTVSAALKAAAKGAAADNSNANMETPLNAAMPIVIPIALPIVLGAIMLAIGVAFVVIRRRQRVQAPMDVTDSMLYVAAEGDGDTESIPSSGERAAN